MSRLGATPEMGGVVFAGVDGESTMRREIVLMRLVAQEYWGKRLAYSNTFEHNNKVLARATDMPRAALCQCMDGFYCQYMGGFYEFMLWNIAGLQRNLRREYLLHWCPASRFARCSSKAPPAKTLLGEAHLKLSSYRLSSPISISLSHGTFDDQSRSPLAPHRPQPSECPPPSPYGRCTPFSPSSNSSPQLPHPSPALPSLPQQPRLGSMPFPKPAPGPAKLVVILG